MRWSVLLLIAACGSSSSHGSPPRDAAIGDGAVDAGPTGDAAVVLGPACSGDLHSVVDLSGNVIATCPDTQGCSGGACIAACDAAAASNGSVGCDFVVATPSFYPPDLPPCFAVFLANNWPVPAAITMARDGKTYSAAQFGRVPDGTANTAGWPAVAPTGVDVSGVAVLFLSADIKTHNTCPVNPAVLTPGGTAVYTDTPGGTQVAQTGIGHAWHLTTSVPVSAYDILPYGGASSALPSAELLLPTTAWGINYVAAGPSPTMGPGFGQIVAATDTTITITPSVGLPAGPGVAAAPAGHATSFTLAAGEFLQWQDAGDMAGSILSSDRPFAFTGGTGYLCKYSLTSTAGGCDAAHQQIPPVSALGSEYVAPPYATRLASLAPESIPYRFVGTAAGTQLTYDPPITGAPATLGLGQVAEFETTSAFTVTSQDAMHPFYVGQYMTGCRLTGADRPGDVMNCLGDEEFVNILPPAQWLSSYVFFTDPTYPVTNLVLVRKAGAAGTFADVTVDCLGTIGGWQSVGTAGTYEITNVDLQRVTPVGTCTNGRHTASSTGAFTVMVWGLANAASYAYPAGGNVGAINPVVVLQ